MDGLSDYTSPVIEFKSCHKKKQYKLVNSSTSTEPLPPKVSVSVETPAKFSQETQTEINQNLTTNVDERKLANWLQQIYPNVEKELLKGCTPMPSTYSNQNPSINIDFQPYQKIALQAVQNSQGLAIWLSVYTNSAPILVVTTIAPHDNWCEHVDQYLKLFVPKRIPGGNFVTYNEMKSIPIKACMKSLCTNPFNKNIFAGSTLDGDIIVWKYEQNFSIVSNKQNNIEINEIYHTALLYGYAVAIDWSGEHTFLTAHLNGYVVKWHLGKEIIKEAEYLIKDVTGAFIKISTLLALSSNEFIIGAKDGSILHCSNLIISSAKHIEIISLKKHLFMATTLLKTNINGNSIVISCDLSGQIYFHDLRNLKDDNDTVVAQIPLPFTNTIACSRDGSTIYSPGEDGSLQCYSLNNGIQHTVKGALKGKGNFIKSSYNGCWIITGLYGNEFQIFSNES